MTLILLPNICTQNIGIQEYLIILCDIHCFYSSDEATLESKSNMGAGVAIDLNSKLGLESAIKAIPSALAKGKYLLDKLTGILPSFSS